MEPTPEAAEDAVGSPLDGELRLLREAILLVASTATPRVVVAGLRFGDLLVDACIRMADGAGVRVSPVRSAGSGRLGFAIEHEAPPAASPANVPPSVQAAVARP
jgi:hypothetical protein